MHLNMLGKITEENCQSTVNVQGGKKWKDVGENIIQRIYFKKRFFKGRI